MRRAIALLALAAVGCSSDPKPAPEPEPQPVAAREAAPKEAPPADPSREEPIAITIKKGERRVPEASYLGQPDKGNVSLDLKDAPLATMVLPLFEKQVAVVIEYGGPPRKVRQLRLDNVPWRDALAIVCAETQTHVIHSQIAGRLELKVGYADPLPFLAKFDEKKKERREDGIGVVGAGSAPRQPRPVTPPGATPPAPQGEEYKDEPIGTTPSQKYVDRVDDIRRNGVR